MKFTLFFISKCQLLIYDIFIIPEIKVKTRIQSIFDIVTRSNKRRLSSQTFKAYIISTLQLM